MSGVSTWLRSPLFWICVLAAALRAAGLFWGLPGADGWDDDGVAPRNFLVGLAESYTPGHHFTYPPLHMILLGLLCLPGIVAALLSAPSLHPADVIATMTQVPYMTFFSVVARLVSIGFSLGTIVVMAKMGALIAGRRAGLLAALVLALNAAFTYYGAVSNLDGPSLLWASLSLYYFMRLMALHEASAIRWAMLCAAAAVATKDQTYALFVLSIPAGLGLWFASDAWARSNYRTIFGGLAFWAIAALAALLVIDGAVINPHGFADRVAFLTGPASVDYEQYARGPFGWLALLTDSALFAPRYYPTVVFLAALIGAGCIAADRTKRAAGLLPLLAIVSFTLAFNFVALRSETRFLLPQSVFIALYAGVAAEFLLRSEIFLVRRAWLASCLLAGCFAFVRCAGITTAFLADPRYDAERWMADHMRPGERVEIYGLNAYLPRFPAGLAVVRVGPKPLKSRNPLPGVKEVRELYGAVGSRRPRYLVVPGFWVADYISRSSKASDAGRIVQKVGVAARLDVDARNYFGALFLGRLPYRLVHRSSYTAPLGPNVNAYESLAQTVYIFEIDPTREFEPIVTVPKSAASSRPVPFYGGIRRAAGDGQGAPRLPGLAFVTRGYHIDRTWGWNA